MNRFIKLKEVKGILKQKIENIKIPIKKLKHTAWFASVKGIKFQDNGVLEIRLGISKLILALLIPLFLLREIGLLLIGIYQKFISPRKKYKCAKGALYQDGTCSSTTKEAFKKHGFIAGIKEYRHSTTECKKAYKTLKEEERRDGTSCGAEYFTSCGGGSCGGDAVSSSAGACDCGAVTPCDVASC
jgi:putative component of membrane protein insertase Oxa1/YidC/SpoIIIJ protein YidD